ncbi:hypothetical protein LOTGIDRAFT_229098 [Lottia gigantea]|uniref:Uncharacterized protein n=1 Tax=Lottia gigantea TaxID=225164 RepID=V4BKT2_LOTGI|nr:hypothetical protein LOTGIDRAFT_229098 [Lottia gigantea]ESO89204.1 hypothetical protein LOTGIDRAFT_229098 [Lottia gigantea]
MSRLDDINHHSERQPLHKNGLDESGHPLENADNDHVSVSLIQHGRITDRNGQSTYTGDSMFQTAENPYRDTTESDPNLQRIPSTDLVPRPWQSFRQVLIVSYISCICCIFTGFAAVRYSQRARRHQNKGLMGMAQKDIKKAVMFIYASFAIGLMLIVFIPIIAVCSSSEGC